MPRELHARSRPADLFTVRSATALRPRRAAQPPAHRVPRRCALNDVGPSSLPALNVVEQPRSRHDAAAPRPPVPPHAPGLLPTSPLAPVHSLARDKALEDSLSSLSHCSALPTSLPRYYGWPGCRRPFTPTGRAAQLPESPCPSCPSSLSLPHSFLSKSRAGSVSLAATKTRRSHTKPPPRPPARDRPPPVVLRPNRHRR